MAVPSDPSDPGLSPTSIAAAPRAAETGVSGLFRGPPAYRPRTPWPTGAALVAAIGIVIFAMSAGLAGSLIVTPPADAPSGDGVWPFVAALSVSQLSAILLTIYAARAFRGRPRDVLSLRPPAQGAASYPVALVMMLAIFGCYTWIVWLIDPNVVTKDVSPFVALMRSEAWWLALAAIAIGAPLMEELVFRGFLLSALSRSRLGFAAGSVVTSAFWTSLHASYSLFGLLEVFAVGLYFSWLLWRTGSLRVPIFCHAAYNAGIATFLMLYELPSPVPAMAG
ncbi:MAG: CPBP family intramembrane metalloprotease [Hyphomicrobiaceae bacterium]|nr:CPBP family intramembrane metalloprotease [Hyphomicrobiaceae bacterium]